MRRMTVIGITTTTIALLCGFLMPASRAQGQTGKQTSPEEISGRYEGVGRSQTRGPIPLVVEIRSANGTVTGTMQTPLGDLAITGGSYAEGKLTLKVESYDDDGIITARFSEGKLVGEFSGFGDAGTIELKRTGAAAPVRDTRPVLSLNEAAWREDLQYLAGEIPRRHKNAFHRVTREQFERAVAELNARIPSLEDSRIVMEMSRLVALVGDGHTQLGWRWVYPRAPVNLFWFGNELRVTGIGAAYRRALGARLIKIGGADTADVYARSMPFIAQGESEGFLRSSSADYISYPVFLHALGLAPDTKHARYTFADERGRHFTLDISAGAPDAKVEWLDASHRTPLYRQRLGDPLWFTYLENSQTVYVNFKGYPRRRAFANFSQELFGFLDHHTVKRLVIDMRQNGGGDFTRGREFLLAGIKQRPAINKRGRLFVIIGRWTYSAGMSNAADFRNETNAILVGEPTGARPNGYQEGRGFSLPNSHLGVTVSVEFYKFQDKDTPGIIPDKRIDPDWASYRRGRDPVLEWILARPSDE